MEEQQTVGVCARRALQRTQAKESQDPERIIPRWASNDEQELWLVDVHHQVEDLCGHAHYCLAMQATSFGQTQFVVLSIQESCFVCKRMASLFALDCPNHTFLKWYLFNTFQVGYKCWQWNKGSYTYPSYALLEASFGCE